MGPSPRRRDGWLRQCWIMGIAKEAVLPLPVSAQPRMSLQRRALEGEARRQGLTGTARPQQQHVEHHIVTLVSGVRPLCPSYAAGHGRCCCVLVKKAKQRPTGQDEDSSVLAYLPLMPTGMP